VEKVADGEMETTCKETIMTYVKEFFWQCNQGARRTTERNDEYFFFCNGLKVSCFGLYRRKHFGSGGDRFDPLNPD
jgi:hypothetical protein